MLAAVNYEAPDLIPVVYHPSPAGLRLHGAKLHALGPMEEVLMGVQAQDAGLMAFLDRLVQCRLGAVRGLLGASRRGV